MRAGFSTDGTRVITAAMLDSSATMIWDVTLSGDADWANFPVQKDWPGNVEFSPDGLHLVATGKTDSVSIWELATGRKVRSIPARGAAPEGSDFQRFDLSADGKLIATAGNDGTTRVWDVSTGKQRFAVVHPGGATSAYELGGGMRPSAAWSADGRYLVTSSPEGTTKIVDDTGSDVRVLRETGDFIFTDADISADDRLVVTVAWPPVLIIGDRIKVFERDSGKLMTTIKAEAHEVKFDPSGARVATANERGVAQIWDVETGESLTKLLGHAGPIMDIAFSPDASTVATAGLDGTIRLWDPDSGEQRLLLRAHRAGVFAVDFSPDGKKLATAGSGDGARVWALDLDDLLEIARDQVTRTLTDDECHQYLHLDDCPT